MTLPAFETAALAAHRARQLAERLQAGDRWAGRDLVFTTELGVPLLASTVRHRFQVLLKAAGLPPRFHDLRDGAATLMLNSGVSARIIQKASGHANYSTTMDLYFHVAVSLQRDAAERLDAPSPTPRGREGRDWRIATPEADGGAVNYRNHLQALVAGQGFEP